MAVTEIPHLGLSTRSQRFDQLMCSAATAARSIKGNFSDKVVSVPDMLL